MKKTWQRHLLEQAFLMLALKNALSVLLRERDYCENPRGFLGSFSNRALLLHCLGLIEKSRFEDLMKIAEIRNIFAHNHLEVTFNSPEVAQKCGEPKVPLGLNGFKSEQYMRDPRSRFTLTVALLSQILLLKALNLQRNAKSKQ